MALVGLYVFSVGPGGYNSAARLPMMVWMAAVILIGFRAFTFKDVELDGNDLIISYFGRQARVPLNTVSAVKGGLSGKNPIKLQFRIPTDFGESISFVPIQRRSMWPWQRHPIVAELQRLSGLDQSQ